jgi:hypothetical protein
MSIEEPSFSSFLRNPTWGDDDFEDDLDLDDEIEE